MQYTDKDFSGVSPVVDIPFAQVDLALVRNPVPLIWAASEFVQTRRFFAESPSSQRSLLSDAAQGLLYTVIRNLRPEHVVEIGTYKAGTAEGMARAMLANGRGILHTVSPFDAERVNAILPRWPLSLRAHVVYHQIDSMAFFMYIQKEGIRPGLVFIDGNHDYEFASFDIQAAAKLLMPGGFIVVDNVSQAGPYFATQEFVSTHPDWIDCGIESDRVINADPFDYARSNIPMTDLGVLRAPDWYTVRQRPVTFGEIRWSEKAVTGVRLSFARAPTAGTLVVQCILRGFSSSRVVQVCARTEVTIDGALDEIDVSFQTPIATDGGYDEYRLEPWFVWGGAESIALCTVPMPY
jgi:predicted O-methyltransferase YrrM